MPQPRKLRAVKEREGNPGRRPIPEGVRLRPTAPPEPDWLRAFPVVRGRVHENSRCRAVARDFWRRYISLTLPVGVVAELDWAVLERAACNWARMQELERQLSVEGMSVRTERGMTKHPASTQLNLIETRFMVQAAKLGMTPIDRDRLNPRGPTGDGDEDFDRPADTGHRHHPAGKAAR